MLRTTEVLLHSHGTWRVMHRGTAPVAAFRVEAYGGLRLLHKAARDAHPLPSRLS